MDKLELGLEVIKKLNNSSYEAYIVGGAVRDYLLEKEVSDIDITTNASLEDIIKIFPCYDLKASKYSGVTIYYENTPFEITTFRKDISYKDHRHPVVSFVDNINDDLIRRDFTMNAMIMDSNKVVIDIFNGKKSLTDKVIYCIGEPSVRFNEDSLRVLRGLYFSSKLGFKLADNIIDSMIMFDYVSYLPKEYIKDMLEKIIDMPNSIGLEYIVRYNILKSFPFYQVLASECLKYKADKKNMYALFYSIHGFLPKNELITNEEYKYAKEVGSLVKNKFNVVDLYNSKGKYLRDAEELFKLIYNDINVSLLYNELPIHSVLDIDFDFSKLPNQKNRSAIQKIIEEKILNHELVNNYDDIFSFVYLRRLLWRI